MNNLRTSCIENATAEVQDCLVIGAGINGSVAAAALAGKGAKVVVVDKGDFASFTSQESSNLAWGGIKYLETYEFGLVWGLCKSRNELMQAYPSQVKEIRFFTSIAKGFRKPRTLVYLGALLYWFMGRCKTRPPRLLSSAGIKREAPMVNTEPLAGGLEYSDCFFMDNDARFCFGFIRRALDAGCSAINYMELVGAERRDGLWHCTLVDRKTQSPVDIRARSIINAAGPFAERINAHFLVQSPLKHIFSKGVHIIVPPVTDTRHVLTFFASDGRLFFMIPMGPCTCIGTTDTPVENEQVAPTDEDIDFLLTNANHLLDLAKPLTREDIIGTRCGVRPLVVRKDSAVEAAEWTALSRKHELDVHPNEKFIGIYGGKLTDCINIGEEVSEIVETFGIAMDCSRKQWYGEPGNDVHARFADECKAMQLDAMTSPGAYELLSTRLWRRYGKGAFGILDEIRRDPAMAEILIEGASYIRGELFHTAKNEMVLHLEDFMRRRSKIELVVDRETIRNAPGLHEAAHILFGEDAEAEIERYSRRVARRAQPPAVPDG